MVGGGLSIVSGGGGWQVAKLNLDSPAAPTTKAPALPELVLPRGGRLEQTKTRKILHGELSGRVVWFGWFGWVG